MVGVIDSHERDYRTLVEDIGVDLAQLSLDEKGTIVANPQGPVAREIGVPRLAVGHTRGGGLAADLVLERKLAEGGRGEVWSAEQVALGRTVAVKRVRAGRRNQADDDALIREGRVLGALEHPSIVPVHALGRGADGESFVVMRLVGGKPWDAELVPVFGPDGPTDEATIERELRVFVQVCHAIEYAHSRGVLHRDLKPANVMVGGFGEVYVLDWGLAVGLDGEGRLPSAASVRTLAGTPGYMAPEMADCDGRRIDRRTDVYLLGALLHELVTGRPRHDAPDHVAQLVLAHRSNPFTYPAAVPRELAAICNRATDRDREHRFADVAALRQAVLAFLRHESSRQLGATATEALRRLDAAVRGDLRGTMIAPGSLTALASEARIGFQVALRAWPENPEAAAGLQRALEIAVDLELQARNASGAAAVLAELRAPRPELVARLRALEAELMRREGELRTLQQLRLDADFGHNAERRRRASLVLSLVLGGAILTLFGLRISGLHRPGYLDAIGLMLPFTLALLFLRRRSGAQSNFAGRAVIDMLTLGSTAVTLSLGLSWRAGVSYPSGVAFALFVAAGASSIATPIVGRRMLGCACCFALGAFAAIEWPQALGLVAAVTAVTAFAIAMWAARRSRAQPLRVPKSPEPH